MIAGALNTNEVASRFVELVREGKNLQAIEELYDDNILSVEAFAMGEMPRETSGQAAVIGRAQWWMGAHEVHAGSASGPFTSVEKFAVLFDYDVTVRASGQRMQLREVGVSTVRDGKIVHEEFLYTL